MCEAVDLGRPGLDHGLGIDLDDRDVVAAGAEVGDRRHEARVDERRQRQDERLRRKDAGRDDVHVAPRVRRLDAGLEQRLHEPEPLGRPHRRLQPTEDAAEGDETDPIAPLEIARRQRGGCAHRVVERAPVVPTDVQEAVDEDDDVGIPLGMPVVHDERAHPTRGCAPVDRAQPVARDEVTDVGVLDPLPLHTGDLAAREYLRLARRGRSRGAGRLADTPSGAVSASTLCSHTTMRRKLRQRSSSAPTSYSPQREQRSGTRSSPLLARREPEGNRVDAVDDLDAVGKVEKELEPVDRVVRADHDRRADLLGLDDALVVERERDFEAG